MKLYKITIQKNKKINKILKEKIREEVKMNKITVIDSKEKINQE